MNEPVQPVGRLRFQFSLKTAVVLTILSSLAVGAIIEILRFAQRMDVRTIRIVNRSGKPLNNLLINVAFAGRSESRDCELMKPNDSISIPAENHGIATLSFDLDQNKKSYNEPDVELWMNETYTFSIQPDGSVTRQR